MRDTRDLVIASVGAGLLVAAAQGAIGGLAFWLLGISGPVIWGVVMALCWLIPLVGAALVWVPTALWLLLSGEIVRGIIPSWLASSASAWPTTFCVRSCWRGVREPVVSLCFWACWAARAPLGSSAWCWDRSSSSRQAVC